MTYEAADRVADANCLAFHVMHSASATLPGVNEHTLSNSREKEMRNRGFDNGDASEVQSAHWFPLMILLAFR